MKLNWKKKGLKIVSLNDLTCKAPVNGGITVKLLPGINEVTEEQWALIEPHVQDSVQRGDLEVVQGS